MKKIRDLTMITKRVRVKYPRMVLLRLMDKKLRNLMMMKMMRILLAKMLTISS